MATEFDANGSPSGNPDAGGAGAKNIFRALDASLPRLGIIISTSTGCISGTVSPRSEIVQTLGDLVRAGRIRHCGHLDIPACVAAKVAAIAPATWRSSISPPRATAA